MRTFTYDDLDRRTKEEWFANTADVTADRTLAWTYNLADELTGVTDRNAAGAAIAADYGYTRDKLGRITTATRTHVGLSSVVTMAHTWDDLGRRKTLEADICATNDFKNTYKYDGLSRLKRLDQEKQGTGAGYNTVAEKRVDLVYNQLGQFTKLTRYSNVSGATEVAHSDYEYDALARLTSLDHEKANNTLLTGYDWTFDNLSRVKSIDFTNAAFNAEDATYTYDATDQLIGVNRSGTANDEAYVNDLNGNRRQSGTTNWKTDTDNRIARDGTFEYTYDKEGNLTKQVTLVSGAPTGATTEFAWDHRNRLMTVTEKTAPTGGTTTKITSFEYDAFDRRIAKTLNSNGAGNPERYEFYVWDVCFSHAKSDVESCGFGDDIIYDFVDADGGASPSATLSKRYLWGESVDQLLAEETIGGATVWDLPDNLGSIRDQVDNTGNLVAGSHVNFDAFGKLTGTPTSRFAFTGQEYDADADAYYYNARWYNPRTGQFASIDPLGFAAGDMNTRRYVENSPTNWTDPTGMDIGGVDRKADEENQRKANRRNAEQLASAGQDIRDARSGVLQAKLDLEKRLRAALDAMRFNPRCREAYAKYAALLQAQLAELDRLDAALAQQHARLKDAFESIPQDDRTFHDFGRQSFPSDFIGVALASQDNFSPHSIQPVYPEQDVAEIVSGGVIIKNLLKAFLRRLPAALGKCSVTALKSLTDDVAKQTAKQTDELVESAAKRSDSVTSGRNAASEAAKQQGSIYKVPGEATPSGKPYIGRHNKPNPAKTRRSPDGRDRTKAEVVDTYDPADTMEGRVREQAQIDQHGGIGNLDNKKNEIARPKPPKE